MSLINKHFEDQKYISSILNKEKIFSWLLENGFYPESHVLPPCFRSKIIDKDKLPTEIPKNNYPKHIKIKDRESISIPKDDFSYRLFSVFCPDIFIEKSHLISNNWQEIHNLLFIQNNKIVSYSFPFAAEIDEILKTFLSLSSPDGRHEEHIIIGFPKGRARYQIESYLKMRERDILSEAYKYKYIVSADIKNFYGSIYTHSIAWAMHGKEEIRKKENKHSFEFIGNKLDKLFQNSNDGCTNGISIGPSTSDLIAELICTNIDIQLSKSLESIDFCAARFKDDYRFLCNSEVEAELIISKLRRELQHYNLQINDEKTEISRVPNGIFRVWPENFSSPTNENKQLTWNSFLKAYKKLVSNDSRELNGAEKFLTQVLHSIPGKFPVNRYDEILSMLLIIGNMKPKSFPLIIAIFEQIQSIDGIKDKIIAHFDKHLSSFAKDVEQNIYRIIWILYFYKKHEIESEQEKLYLSSNNKFIKSILNDKFELFPEPDGYSLFEKIENQKNKLLSEEVTIFNTY